MCPLRTLKRRRSVIRVRISPRLNIPRLNPRGPRIESMRRSVRSPLMPHESSPNARRDSRPFAAQQALVQLDSRNDGPPSSQRSIVIKTDSHDRRHAVAAGEVRTSVAGNAIRNTEANRSSHAGNIKISIGKIDLQVHQQPDRPVPVPTPVRTRERPSKPSRPGDNYKGAIGNGNMSRYYFRWY